MPDNPTKVCRLCNQTVPALLDSHIVPEWAYTILYNRQHKFLPIRLLKASPDKEQQKGFREEILCADCERRFSKYEAYAKHFFFSLANNKLHRMREERLTERVSRISSFQYKKIKYCLLSILWRMSVCSREQFAGYKIPDEETVRKLLLQEADIPEGFYPVVISRTTFNGKYLESVFLTYKDHVQIEGLNRFRVVLMGISVDYFIGVNVASKLIRFQCLKDDGSFLLAEAEVGDLLNNTNFLQLLRSQRVKDHFGDVN